MTSMDISKLRVLFFDVFGTCVAQLPPIASELQAAAATVLQSNYASVPGEIRRRAEQMV